MALPDIIEYCVCASCVLKHVKPGTQDAQPCYVAAAQQKHARDIATLIPKDSRTVSIGFTHPAIGGDGHTRTIHIAILAYYSRVIERLVKESLACTNKRLVSVVTFEDDILSPQDVELLVEWCYTGALASLGKAYQPPPTPVNDDNDEDEDEDDDGSSSSSDEEGKAESNADASKDDHPIPKFAAEDTIERLYCIAANLEMPEFANYCMYLVMAKYNWNFFCVPGHGKKRRGVEDDRSEIKRPKDNNTNNHGTGGSHTLKKKEDDKDDDKQISHDQNDSQTNKKKKKKRKGKKGKKNNKLVSAEKRSKPKAILNFRGAHCKVPFYLMLRDAPYSPDGMRLILRQSVPSASSAPGGDSSRMTRRLRTYLGEVLSQRNIRITIGYTDMPRKYKAIWQAVYDGNEDEALLGFMRQRWDESIERNKTEAIGVATKLLQWQRYLVSTTMSSSSNGGVEITRDPDTFWAELEDLRISDVVITEDVGSRTLRTPEDDKYAIRWTRPVEYEHEGGAEMAHINKIVAKEMFEEKRDVSAFRFSDY